MRSPIYRDMVLRSESTDTAGARRIQFSIKAHAPAPGASPAAWWRSLRVTALVDVDGMADESPPHRVPAA